MADQSFFEESREQSEVKSAIVTKYIVAWARAIIPAIARKDKTIAYIDLFAGPGRYEDGTKSTPICVIEEALKTDQLKNNLACLFNDKESKFTTLLEQEIEKTPRISELKNKPRVFTGSIDEEVVLQLEQTRLVPTILFLDPWGYKGLSLALIRSVLKDFGCECIFFFNYNRINMALTNPVVENHIEALFGIERLNKMRAYVNSATLSPAERESFVLEEPCQALKEMGGNYVLPFRFKNAQGNRTSHHLVFVTKHVLGYRIMKDVMVGLSESEGVGSFEFNPATKDQAILFPLSRSLEDLKLDLLSEYSGRTITVSEIFEKHNIGTPFVEKNYKTVLKELESAGKISAEPTQANRRKDTLGNKVVITFPQSIQEDFNV